MGSRIRINQVKGKGIDMQKELEYYKKNAHEVFNRFDMFYGAVDKGETGNFVFRALLDSDIELYRNIKLNSYDFTDKAEIDRYVDDVIFYTEKAYEARREVLDDTLPVISPILGIGDYSAFVAGDIVFSEDTSWSQPVLENLEDWRNLEEVGTSVWYARFMNICEKLMKKVQHNGIPFMRGFFSPLDLAQALRGDALYTDFYDNPDEVHRLLDFCADATIKFAEDIMAMAEEYLVATPYGTYFMKNSINMSEDIACMISPEMYREFEAPYTQKVINHFGNGFLHCHSRALYLVPELCRLKNVKNIWIATDPNQPKPIEVLEELIEKSNNVCLSIDCDTIESVVRNIDIAKSGNVAFCIPAGSVEEANRFTDIIRKHSKI